MKADFSGYATKAGIKCSDGRTIMPNAFDQQDKVTVPLVWQHDHDSPKNVLGHALLEARPDGMYTYGFFNETPEGQHAKQLVKHKDITMLSIYANQIIERSKNVLHGAIREVSLVLSGANPGARIDNVNIAHGDGETGILEDEVIIRSGLTIELEHSEEEPEVPVEEAPEEKVEEAPAETEEAPVTEEQAKETFESFSEDQKDVVHKLIDKVMVLSAMDPEDENLEHADLGSDATIQEIYDTFTPQQLDVVHYMIGQALEAANLEQDNLQQDNLTTDTEGNTMTKNIFETKGETTEGATITHSDITKLFETATKSSSLKSVVNDFAIQHGINNIDQLFPDAQNVQAVPEWLKRRTEWVDQLLMATRKSPFSRIKTMYADITADEARAKGYIKGTLKKEEFFSVSKRVTTPTTVYKKQKLDRDDMIDITDFDVVMWLKSEMRLMLDEEIARAILVGDGRDGASEDKINEGNIRPIASDHELYTVTVNVNVLDASSNALEVIEAVIRNRSLYKGTGQPNFYTTESQIAKFLLLKDTQNRRLYKNLQEVADDLRVAQIVPVEVLEEYPTIIGIMVNPVDYVIGADKGGQVTLFDDFDIDFNQQKYLIETRISGALVRLKSAIVVKSVAAAAALVVPTVPTFVATTGVVTIPTQTGTVYKNAAGTTLTAGAQTAIAAGASITIVAEPASASYFFENNSDDNWTFTRNP